MDYYNGHFGGMHLVWWFIWLIVIVYIVYQQYNSPLNKSKKEDPLDILKRRYANGEISKDEYEESVKTLDQSQ